MRYLFFLFLCWIIWSCKKGENTPAAPTELAVTPISTSQINLSWADNSSNETGFQVERKKSSGTFALVANLPPNTTTYSDTGLTKKTTYTYRVSSLNGASTSLTYSQEVSATTFDDVPAPAANLTAKAVSPSQINLSWEDKATTETGFKVERRIGNGSYSRVATLDANITSFTDKGLTANTIYTYKVFPFNAFGNGDYSNEASDTTLPDIESGLLAYYPFSGNGGDSSGNGNHASVNGPVPTADRWGNANKAYYFNGTTDWIESSVKNLPIGNETRSFSFWAKQTAIPISAIPSAVFHYGKMNVNQRFTCYYFLTVPAVVAERNDACYICNQSLIGTNIGDIFNKWSHVVITHDGTLMKCYVNGILYFSSYKTYDTQLSILIIGRTFAGYNTGEFFQGMIDDVRVYDRALTQEQVSFLANH